MANTITLRQIASDWWMLCEASEDAPTRPRLMWFARTERDVLAKRARHIERINHAWAVGTCCRPDFTRTDCPETGQSVRPATTTMRI